MRYVLYVCSSNHKKKNVHQEKKLKLSVICHIMNGSATVVFNSQNSKFKGNNKKKRRKKSNLNHKNKVVTRSNSKLVNIKICSWVRCRFWDVECWIIIIIICNGILRRTATWFDLQLFNILSLWWNQVTLCIKT